MRTNLRKLSLFLLFFTTTFFISLLNTRTVKAIHEFSYVKAFGGTGAERVDSSAVDSSGNVYLSGYFTGTVNFNPDGTAVSRTSKGQIDAFVTKRDSNGNHLWTKAFGGQHDDKANGVTVDGNGDIYLTGSFAYTVNFNPDGSASRTSNGSSFDIYISKWSSAGVFQWVKAMGSPGGDYGLDIAASKGTTDGVYATGYFIGTVNFNPDGTYNLTCTGTDSAFLTKWSRAGVFQWAFMISGTTGSDHGQRVAVDSSGNVFLAGYFTGTNVNFNPRGTAMTRSTPHAYYKNMFIAKYNSSGICQWVKSMGRYEDDDPPYAVATDSVGNVFVGGDFFGTVNFNPDGSDSRTANTTYYDAFLSKWSSSGVYQWTKTFGNTNTYETVLGIAVDSNNDAYINGYFQGTVNFNPGGSGGSKASVGDYDVFVVNWSGAGVFQWVKTFGGTSGDYGRQLSIDSNNNLYVPGQFQGTVNFNPDGTAANKTSVGSTDVFLVKYNFIAPPVITINNPDTTPAQSKTITANADSGTLTMSINAVGVTTCNASNTYVAYTPTTFTSESDNGRYVCYRAVNTAGTTYALSNQIQGIVSNTPPSVSNIVINGGSNISLNAGTTKAVTITATITDSQGYSDISSASLKFYRSGVGSSCSANYSNCYSTSCSLSGCSGNSCTATCNLNMQFYADATDAGTYASENWTAQVSATDTKSATGSYTNTTEVLTLRALSLTQSSINYGTLTAGQNTGSSNVTVTVNNRGNVSIDVETYGTDMCSDYPTCSDSTKIPVGNQKYGMSTFTYSSGGTALTGSGVRVDLSLAKSTNGTFPSKNIYWGIGIPSTVSKTTKTGRVYINAVADT